MSLSRSATMAWACGLSFHTVYWPPGPVASGVQTCERKPQKALPRRAPSSQRNAGCQMSQMPLLFGVPESSQRMSKCLRRAAMALERCEVRCLNTVNSSMHSAQRPGAFQSASQRTLSWLVTNTSALAAGGMPFHFSLAVTTWQARCGVNLAQSAAQLGRRIDSGARTSR
ncbi:hypothetical protein D9M70_499640 [compost metagenome]